MNALGSVVALFFEIYFLEKIVKNFVIYSVINDNIRNSWIDSSALILTKLNLSVVEEIHINNIRGF